MDIKIKANRNQETIDIYIYMILIWYNNVYIYIYYLFICLFIYLFIHLYIYLFIRVHLTGRMVCSCVALRRRFAIFRLFACRSHGAKLFAAAPRRQAPRPKRCRETKLSQGTWNSSHPNSRCTNLPSKIIQTCTIFNKKGRSSREYALDS